MGQVRYGSATTKHAVRAAIQRSQASTAEVNRTVEDAPLNRFYYENHHQLRAISGT